MKSKLLRRKALACLLVLAMMFSFMGGMVTGPSVVQAEENDEFLLRVGSYRGLTQEPSVTISVENAQDLVALEFTVESANIGVDLAVTSVEGTDDIGDARVTKSGLGHGNVKIGIIWETGSFSGDGDLVEINYTHKGEERTEAQVIDLEIDPDLVTARVIDPDAEGDGQIFDDDTVYLDITDSSIDNGKLTIAIMFGDMNKDEEVTINDALLALRASVGDLELTPQLKDAGDVKRTVPEATDVTVYDALLIARYAVGLIDWFPVSPPPGVDPNDIDDDDELTAFTEPPSSIWIGDKELVNPRTDIGGEVTFTVKFDNFVIGDIRVQIGDLTNTEFLSGKEVDITMDLDDPALYGGTGNWEVRAFQYNSETKEEGVPLSRFVKVVDPSKPDYDTPDLEIDATYEDGKLDFEWDKPVAASKITIRQSFDHGESKRWTDARIENGPIKSDANSATVTGLDKNRGYYFKLRIDGGPNAGESDIVTFMRMSGDAIAEQAGDDLYVYILYNGYFEDLNLAAAGDFMLVKNDSDVQAANEIEVIRPGANGVKLLFDDLTEDNFTIKYEESAGPLDNDLNSYVLAKDSVDVGDAGVITEVTVTSRLQFLSALGNSNIDKIVLAGDIALIADLDVNREVIIDGQNHTITGGDVDITASDVTVQDITIVGDVDVIANEVIFINVTVDGDLDINGDDFTGQSVTVTGETTVNGADAEFNTTFEGDVTVTEDGDRATFKNVTFEADLTIEAGADEATVEDSTIAGDVLVEADDVTFTNVTIEGDLTVNGDDFTGESVTVEGIKTLNGEDAVFNSTFKGNVILLAGALNAAYENVTFGANLTVGATGLEVKNSTIEGNVNVGATGAKFESVNFKGALSSSEDFELEGCRANGVSIPDATDYNGDILPGSGIAQLEILTQPAATRDGDAVTFTQPVIAIRDAQGNTVTSAVYGITATVAVQDDSNELSLDNYTATDDANDNGIVTFGSGGDDDLEGTLNSSADATGVRLKFTLGEFAGIYVISSPFNIRE